MSGQDLPEWQRRHITYEADRAAEAARWSCETAERCRVHHAQPDDDEPHLDIEGKAHDGCTKGRSREQWRYHELRCHYQSLKKKLRLQLVDDLVELKANKATDEQLLKRIEEHHYTRSLARDLLNEATFNRCAMPSVSSYSFHYLQLIEWSKRPGSGIPADYLEHVLWVRPLFDEDTKAEEDFEKRHGLGKWAEKPNGNGKPVRRM
jgi:hypothetical protein